MRIQHPDARRSLVAVVALVAFGSCSDSSPAPTPIAVAPAASVVRLELVAPESIPPGTSVQLRVRDIRSDGSSRDVTSGVQWSSSETSVLQVDPQGVATANGVGESRVTAIVNQRQASSTVLVMPAGTFRLSGRLLEAGIAVSGAIVSVVGGVGQGLTTTTNDFGHYALVGVAGTLTLQITKAGYQAVTRQIEVIGNTRYEDIAMSPEKQREALSGQYRLTITAADCSSIPEEFRRRSYDARVDQLASWVNALLSGADFMVFTGVGNHFGGSYELDGSVSFVLARGYFNGYYDNVSPDVVERVTPSSAIVISGHASTRVNGSVIAGQLSGTFALTGHLNSFFPPYASECQSSGHGFELRRQ
jgi:hypothetical protein